MFPLEYPLLDKNDNNKIIIKVGDAYGLKQMLDEHSNELDSNNIINSNNP